MFLLFRYVERISSQQLHVRHSGIRICYIGNRKFVCKLQRLLATHPINKHCTFMERKVIFIASIKLSTKCNFIFVASGDGDAILLSIDYYFTTVVTGPSILWKRDENV